MRFGLSPYSNPIDAAVNTGLKVFNTFQSIQDRAQGRQLHQLQMKREQNALDEQEKDKPIREARRQKELLDYENEVLTPHWDAAEKEFNAAAREGREPNFTPEQTAAVEAAAKRSKVDLNAVHDLADHIQKWMPVVQQSPQDRILLNDPQLLDDFNKTYGQQLGGKNVKSIFYDKKANVFALGVDDGNGGTAPLTTEDGKYTKQIPADQVMKDVVHHGIASSIVQAARYNSDPEYRKKVKLAEERQQENIIQRRILGEIPDDASPTAKRTKYAELAAMYGSNMSPKDIREEAKAIFPDKAYDKPTRDIVADNDSPTGWSYLTEQGNKLQGAQDPNAKEDRQDRRMREREDRQDRRTEHRLAKSESNNDRKSAKAEIDKAAKEFSSVRDKVNKFRQKIASAKDDEEKQDLRGQLDDFYKEDDDARRNYEKLMQDYHSTYGEEYTGGGLVTREKKPARGKIAKASTKPSGLDLSQFDR